MKVNFNNEEEVKVEAQTLPAFIDKVKNRITGNGEHLYLEFKIGRDSYEKKWHRFENADDEIVSGVEKFIKSGFEVEDGPAEKVEPKKTTSTKAKPKTNAKKK